MNTQKIAQVIKKPLDAEVFAIDKESDRVVLFIKLDSGNRFFSVPGSFFDDTLKEGEIITVKLLKVMRTYRYNTQRKPKTISKLALGVGSKLIPIDSDCPSTLSTEEMRIVLKLSKYLDIG